jgi:hypothetical protein
LAAVDDRALDAEGNYNRSMLAVSMLMCRAAGAT